MPEELIINVDQTPPKFVAADKVIMAAISRAGATDKRTITVTHIESLDSPILPFQLIYTGKMQRSLPNVTFLDRFCLAYNRKHWSPTSRKLSNKNSYHHLKRGFCCGMPLRPNQLQR